MQHHFPSTAVIDEVAILVSNHTMHKGDRGVVIVGASAESDLMVGGLTELQRVAAQTLRCQQGRIGHC